jgi:hypothetical protein
MSTVGLKSHFYAKHFPLIIALLELNQKVFQEVSDKFVIHESISQRYFSITVGKSVSYKNFFRQVTTFLAVFSFKFFVNEVLR